ncbi:hypothetical protein [Okeania sp.]|uniref:hypothetical protein n=1 Tax=Okeania sp. TaxID=3100323 RepID=UPI002B4B5F8C|nr:hypothetical protein [Okeania sp.]MEB3342989.1 hypothetical protein [Okeania sp.]
MTKSIDVAKKDYNTLILGTSRAFNGLDPLADILTEKSAYNASFNSSNIYEMHKVFQLSLHNKNLKTIIISLDFFAFSDHKQVSGDFRISRFATKYFLLLNLHQLISLQNFQYSLETIKFNLKGIYTRQFYTKQGFRQVKDEYIPHRELFIKQSNEYFNTYSIFSYSQERFILFKEILEKCHQNNIQVYLFISPIHARQLEILRVMNKYVLFEQWKRDLVDIVEEANQEYSNQAPFLLFDFTGYNSITTESIPVKDSQEQMKWYTESSHYKKELGNLVLDIILNYPSINNDIYDNFGIVINNNNIESHLANIRIQQRKYHKNFPNELIEIENLSNQKKKISK